MRTCLVIVLLGGLVGTTALCGKAAQRKESKPSGPKEPAACVEFKNVLCKHCGETSVGCQEVRKRRGSNAAKCRAGLKHVGMHVNDPTRLKLLCDLLSKGSMRPSPRP